MALVLFGCCGEDKSSDRQVEEFARHQGCITYRIRDTPVFYTVCESGDVTTNSSHKEMHGKVWVTEEDPPVQTIKKKGKVK